MPDDTATDLRNAVIDRDGYKLINESLTRSVEFYKTNQKLEEEKVNILLTQDNNLAGALKDAQGFNNTQRVLWFVLGIAVTGIAVYGVKTLSNK